MEIFFIAAGGAVAGAGVMYILLMKNILLLRQENSVLAERVSNSSEKARELSDRLDQIVHQNSDLNSQNMRLLTEQDHLNEQLASKTREMIQIQEKLQKDFENLSGKILERNSEKFSNQNRQLLTDLLNPLKEKMEKYEARILRNQQQNHELGAAMREQLLSFKDIGLQMSQEATNLARALKGNNKQQGNWGEIILERVLEASGLQREREYILQASRMDLKDDSGKRQQPDVIIMLPENKHLVIDAKVPLVAYEAFCNEEDETERLICLQQHLESVRSHIRNLSGKRYHLSEKLITPEFVLLFIPVEPSFMLALQHDPNLFNLGWEKRIVLVSPTTLLATLRTVASIWKYEKQNTNAVEIARIGGLLYDQFVGFTEEMEKVGRSIDSSQKAFDGAMHKLRDSRQSLVSRANRLHKLGVKAAKDLKPGNADPENEI
ncbi:MAG: DNA recombination protein RmuC [Bacteroidia bacterium]